MAIALAVLVLWWPTLAGTFVLDDHESVVTNTSIRDLASLDWLFPPATGGETVSGRPILNLSFALDYACAGLSPTFYHAINIALHAGSALLLLALIRQTLERRRVEGATTFAGLAALLWAVHPLQTAAVSYIAQRAEVLAAFWMLLTLQLFVRGESSPHYAARWRTGAVVACLLGMGTKETMVAAPVIVFLYDRIFIRGSWRAAWQARRSFYAALAATWLPLAALVWANHGRGGSAGLGSPVDTWSYLQTQGWAICHYLRLLAFPVGLTFDHGMLVVTGWIPVLALLLLACLAATAWWLLRSGSSAGFLLAAFFVLLAPTSSVVPISTQTVAEHRMYLPSAVAILALGTLAMQRHPRLRRLVPLLAGVVVIALAATTWARNELYRSPIALWADTVAKRPENARAHNNLGQALADAGRTSEATAAYRKAIALNPDHAIAHFNLGVVALAGSDFAEAEQEFRRTIAIDPRSIGARINLGQTLSHTGRLAEAEQQWREALALDGNAYDAATNLGAALVSSGRGSEGEHYLRAALRLRPELAEAYYHLGRAREQAGDRTGALSNYRSALKSRPDFAAAHLALGNCLTDNGDLDAAERSVREAIRLTPQWAEAKYALGNVFAARHRFGTAMDFYREAIAINPQHIPARTNLGNCLLAAGRIAEAADVYRKILAEHPEEPTARANLALIEEYLRSLGGR